MARQRFFLTRAHEIRISYLVGCGCTIEEIMDDTEIPDRNLINNFILQSNLELKTGAGGKRTIPIQISAEAYRKFTRAAAKRDIIGADKGRKSVQRYVEAGGSSFSLIDNVLNDGIRSDA